MSDLDDLLPSTETVEHVVNEVRHGNICIGVFGEFSSGKSTFLNALMGEELLTVAVDPTTATPTRIIYARDFNVLVQGMPRPGGSPTELARLFTDKVPTWARFVGKGGILTVLQREGAQIRAFLERWTREGEDAARTSAVVLCLPQPFLKDRICLIDTPGANNEFTRHHQITEQVAAQVDIAICLLDARQGGKRSELDFVVTVASTAPKTVLVLNKIDCIPEDEREDVVYAIHEALRSRWPADKGDCPEPWPCSAKAALDPGLASAHSTLVDDFADLRRRLTDLAVAERGSLILHRTGGLDRTLRTLATEAEHLGQLDIAHRALDMCLTLFGEAEIEDPEVLAQFTRIEEALQANIPKLTEAYSLLDLAERKLSNQRGVATAEVRDAVLRATLIFRQMNQTDERLERIRLMLKGSPAETSLVALGAEVAAFEASFPSPGDQRFIESLPSERVALWKHAAATGVPVAQLFIGVCAQYGLGSLTTDDRSALDWFRKAAEQGHVIAQNRVGVCFDKGLGIQRDEFQAVEWYRKAADQGYAAAQCSLGYCFATGQGVPQDFAQAVHWYRKAADQGYAAAQCSLGYCFDTGQGVPQDFAQAVHWYRKAAEQGDADAQWSLGYCFDTGQGVPQDFAQAVHWYRKAADQGYAAAQWSLGYCFDTGQGVPQDFAQAVHWYRKAAEQGNAYAQYRIGVCYANGQGVPQDFAQAVHWYRKAADQGHAAAQWSLGYCFDTGQGVPQDFALAVHWYRKAADQGHALGQVSIGDRYANGEGVPQDFAQAVHWYRKAADQGSAFGQCTLGGCYESGQGVPQDFAQAVQWYRKAAEQRDADAQYCLGLCYYKGSGVPQDFPQAFHWCREAADQGHAEAQCWIGLRYGNGEGGPRDYPEAVHWYRMAAAQGYSHALYLLGHCYEHGQGVPQSLSVAVSWYRKAADQGDANASRSLQRIT